MREIWRTYNYNGNYFGSFTWNYIVKFIFVCMRYDIARGIYSNGANLGTAAMLHCDAKVYALIE